MVLLMTVSGGQPVFSKHKKTAHGGFQVIKRSTLIGCVILDKSLSASCDHHCLYSPANKFRRDTYFTGFIACVNKNIEEGAAVFSISALLDTL